MVNTIIAELEQLIVKLAEQSGRSGVSPQTVAMTYAPKEWNQYTELVQEAARLLQQRALIVVTHKGTRYRSP